MTQNAKKIIQFRSDIIFLNKRTKVYKIIKVHPTKEQISALKIKVAQEDDYIDYVVDLNALSKDQKAELCDLYNLDLAEVEEKDKLKLTVSSSV